MKGYYAGPNTQQGSLTASNPMDLLYITFTRIELLKDGRERHSGPD